MLISFILDPEIFNINNFTHNSEHIVHVKNNIDNKNSIIVIDKMNKIKSKLIDNIEKVINEQASIEIIEDTNDLTELFKDEKKFYTETNFEISEKGNSILEFAIKTKNRNKNIDFFVHDIKSGIDDNDFIINFRNLFKNNKLKIIKKKLIEFENKNLSENGFKNFEEYLSRIIWNSDTIDFFDPYVTASLKYNPEKFNWEWDKTKKIKKEFVSLRYLDRKKSLEWLKEFIEKNSTKNLVNINIYTWFSNSHENKNMLQTYFNSNKQREMQSEVLSEFKIKIQDLLPENSTKVKFNLIIKKADYTFKQHLRVLKTDNCILSLGFGIDFLQHKINKKKEIEGPYLVEDRFIALKNMENLQKIIDLDDL